ncbi:hypothetical protein [Myroides sp. WP-1]|uniref:hypothetical protein n=1 Tax=Myroides sp. WP-1 TaxID=2759944 RepID=UPI0021048E8C|nr:hypothetical protein [Myroides sp. WP-1]
MKKVLEAELLSIVHRVLQMKDTDVDKLYVEAKELYEKLQILKFYQDNLALGLVKDITEDQLVEKLSGLTVAETTKQETVPVEQPAVEEEEMRSQIPTDLIVEDYPIVVEAEKETVVNFEAFADAKEEQATLEEELEKEEKDEFESEIKEEEIQEQTHFGDDLVEEEEIEIEVELEEEAEIEIELEHEIEEEEEEDEIDTEEDALESFEEQELADQMVTETSNTATFERNEEEIVEEDVFVSLTTDQREDNPFEGFDFGEIEFIRVEDIAKEDTILVDDHMFERLGTEQPVETEEVQSTASFFAQQKEEQEEKEEAQTKEEEKTENQQNMLFNLDQVSVREPRIVKKTINDIYRGTIMVGLNDRIAFEKHLFSNSSEDFNRVLSQLNTVSTFDEAKSFVEHLVKPEYNNWEGKEEYAERFMALIEKRFE